jgi:two-component sensor histidine kinase
MSWHAKLDRLAAEFLEETDAILGAVEDRAERMRYVHEIMYMARDLHSATISIHLALLRDDQ